jgi:hypothetical protein
MPARRPACNSVIWTSYELNRVSQVGVLQLGGVDFDKKGMDEHLGDAASIPLEDLDHFGFERIYFRLANLNHCLGILRMISRCMLHTTTFQM